MMTYFNFETDHDGQLIYQSRLGKRGMVASVSETIPYPETTVSNPPTLTVEDHTGSGSYEVEFEGEKFKLEMFFRNRTGMFDPWAYGVKVYSSDGELLADSFLYGRYPGGFELKGSREFFHNDAWYLLFNGSIDLSEEQMEHFPQLIGSGFNLIKLVRTKFRAQNSTEGIREKKKDAKGRLMEMYLNM